jgi:hypothetical protein
MRPFVTAVFCTLLAQGAWAQHDSAAHKKIAGLTHATYIRHAVTVTGAIGFADDNRTSYTLPPGFSKGVVSGFAPLFARVEYGLTDNISLGASLCYDAFEYNNLQNYNGNNGPFNRYKTNNTRIASGGLAAFYHLGGLINCRRIDPFAGIGLELNNLRYKAYPQGDTTAIRTDHTVTLYLKAGVRCYLTDQFSLYADAGYDKQAIVTIGASCRFFTKRRL